MKTNLRNLRLIMMLMLLLSTTGAWAQVTIDPDHACLNSTQDYWVINTPGSTYNWILSGGGTITTGPGTDQIKVNWTTTGSYSLTVTETITSTGCIGVPVTLNIIVDPLPIPIIAGPTPVCVNSTGNVYTTDAGMSNYVWAVSAGGTITAGGTSTDNTVTVTWNAAVAQTVSVNYNNSNGCTAATATVYNVSVNPLPVVGLTGTSPVCVNSTGNVYTTDAGMSNYVWAVSAGGTITAGGTSTDNTVTVTWNAAVAQTVSVNYNNSNGCTAAAATIYNVTVNPLPVPTVTGPVAACVTSTTSTYTTEADMSNYLWTISGGGTITAGAATNAITVTWNTAGAQTVSANYDNANGCTAAAATVYNVTVNPLPVPTITGPTPICAATTSQVYITESGMTGYIWNVSAGGTITAGGTATDNTVTITWNTAGPQSVTVNYINENGCTAATPTVKVVTVNSLPATSPIYHN